MATFKSHDSYSAFARSIRNEYRHAFAEDALDFLKRLGRSLEVDPAQLEMSTNLCRAQVGHSYRPIEDDNGKAYDEQPCAYGPERMKPLRDQASEGRINPKGIPCLYLATDRATAIAEVRPSRGQFVSLGYFEVLRDCKLANFSAEYKRHFYFEKPPEAKVDDIVLGHLNFAFSAPVQASDMVAEYAPTQVIAEYMRKIGYDGIYYKSSLGPGMNVALFSLDDADLKACDLYVIDGIEYSFNQADNTYFVSMNREATKAANREGEAPGSS